MREIAVRVEGLVQGVGFRWFVRDRARALGLRGWVWNAPDGAVELAAAGEDAALEAFRAALERGPPGSRVSRLVPLAGEHGAAQRGEFEIARGPERPRPWRSPRDADPPAHGDHA